MQCWRKGEIPARLNYGTNPRIPPYLCLAETGWQIFATMPADNRTGGNHGFDPRYPELWGMRNIGQTGGTAEADIDATIQAACAMLRRPTRPL